MVCSQLGEEVICHKADLRFVSISGQKVLDTVQGVLEQAGGSNPALCSTSEMVTEKLHDANHRYTALHTKVTTFSDFMVNRNFACVHTSRTSLIFIRQIHLQTLLLCSVKTGNVRVS